MSCDCESSSPCNPDTPFPSVSPESVPSLINNLVTAMYGAIYKDASSGVVKWVIPCDPTNTATAHGITRNEGEGLMCYFLRVLADPAIIGATGASGPAGATGAAGPSGAGATGATGVGATGATGLTGATGSGAFGLFSSTYTGNGSTTTFAISGSTTSSVSQVFAFIDGVSQTPSTDYAVSAGVVTFASSPPNGSKITLYAASGGVAGATGPTGATGIGATGATGTQVLLALRGRLAFRGRPDPLAALLERPELQVLAGLRGLGQGPLGQRASVPLAQLELRGQRVSRARQGQVPLGLLGSLV
jgi:hypothetical protein